MQCLTALQKDAKKDVCSLVIGLALVFGNPLRAITAKAPNLPPEIQAPPHDWHKSSSKPAKDMEGDTLALLKIM